MDIKFIETANPKQIPDFTNLRFGNYFSDHMFVMDYSIEKGWHDAKIMEYSNFEVSPSNMTLHYGQSIFEGLKAYKTDNNEIQLFRPEENIKRLNISCDRMCIPEIDVNLALESINELVKIDSKWIPDQPGTSLYIRPFIFATDPFLGVRPSFTYKFVIITGPVGAYYPEGLNPVKIYVENKYVRAVKGGVGNAKTCGNYAASLKAQLEANEKGFTQVLWLDGMERKYVEEVGTMNVFFVIDNEIITPSLEGSILPGITRKSVIEILKKNKYTVVERKITIDEVFDAHKKGTLIEVFGSGTAAVISPVGQLCWNDKIIIINDEITGDISQMLYNTITNIQYGLEEDSFGWIKKLT